MRMKKVFAMLLALSMVLSMAACGKKEEAAAPGTAATEESGEEGSKSGNFEDQGYKMAYILNVQSSDLFVLQGEAAKKEAESLGMSVDVFFADGDATKLQNLFQQAVNQGYDAIFCHGASETYAAEMVQPAVDKGIPVIAFEYKCRDEEGNVLPGVTEMLQDDAQMSEALCEYIVNELYPDKEKINVLKIYADIGFDPFIRRSAGLDKYVESGKFNIVETIGPSVMDAMKDSVMTNVAAILPTIGKDIDVIWSCYDALADGAYLALKDAGMDIPVVTVDISNEDIQYMLEDGSCFKACASPAPQTVGQQAVRILAMKLHGDEVEDNYMVSASLVRQSDISEGANVTNLGEIIEGYGVCDDHLPEWMVECKARTAGN